MLPPLVFGVTAAIVTAFIAVLVVGPSPKVVNLALAGGLIGGWLALAIRGWRCPACGSEEIRRSHRRPWERLLTLALLRPYRCRHCHRRFWGLIA